MQNQNTGVVRSIPPCVIIKGALVQWLSVRNDNLGVESLILPRVTKNAIGEAGNGEAPHKIHFPIKT